MLRDLEGVVHTIANGDIRTLANQSKDFSYYVIDLGVDYDDDADASSMACARSAARAEAGPGVRVTSSSPSRCSASMTSRRPQVTLRFRIKTLPLKQWEVGRELRRRIKKAFDAQASGCPAPQLDVTLRSGLTLV